MITIYRLRIRFALWLRAMAERVEGPYQHFSLLTTARECEEVMRDRYNSHCANPKEHAR